MRLRRRIAIFLSESKLSECFTAQGALSREGLEVALTLLTGLAMGACFRSWFEKRARISVTRRKAGLTEPPKTDSTGDAAAPSILLTVMRSFLLAGVIRDLPVDGQTVIVRHERFPDSCRR